MVIVSGFDEGVEALQAGLAPKLAGAFAAALFLATGRLDRPTADGPAAGRHFGVVHPPGLPGKIVLFAPQDFSAPQPVQLLFHPRPPLGFMAWMQRFSHAPEVVAGVVEVQQLVRAGPTIVNGIPNPVGPVAHSQ